MVRGTKRTLARCCRSAIRDALRPSNTSWMAVRKALTSRSVASGPALTTTMRPSASDFAQPIVCASVSAVFSATVVRSCSGSWSANVSAMRKRCCRWRTPGEVRKSVTVRVKPPLRISIQITAASTKGSSPNVISVCSSMRVDSPGVSRNTNPAENPGRDGRSTSGRDGASPRARSSKSGRLIAVCSPSSFTRKYAGSSSEGTETTCPARAVQGSTCAGMRSSIPTNSLISVLLPLLKSPRKPICTASSLVRLCISSANMSKSHRTATSRSVSNVVEPRCSVIVFRILLFDPPMGII